MTMINGINHATLLVDDCNQEVHIIVASRSLSYEDLFIRIGDAADITRRHVHRHVALVVSEWEGLAGAWMRMA